MGILAGMTQRMTEGSPWGLIPRFLIPLLLGNLFQQLYNLTDTLIVGRFVGIQSLAAVGESTSVVFLIIGFCSGCCCGFGIPVARAFGAKDERLVRQLVANILYLGAVMAVVMTVGTCLCCSLILHLLHTPADIFRDAWIYLFVIFAGIPSTFLYNVFANILRSVGDSRTPFIFLAAAAVLNVFLDLFCIIVLKMGVFGAALATIVAQYVSGFLCLFSMLRKTTLLRFEKGDTAFSSKLAQKILADGLPMGLQYSITAIGSMLLQGAVNLLGSAYVASYTVAIKIKQFFISPYDPLGSTMATYCGQNMGAHKYKRLSGGLSVCIILGLCYSVCAWAVLTFCGLPLVNLFVADGGKPVIANAVQFLHCTAPFYPILAFLCIFRYSIQALGYGPVAIISGILEMIARGTMGLVVIPLFGWIAVCYTDQSAWGLTTLFLIPTYFVLLHRRMRTAAGSTAEN